MVFVVRFIICFAVFVFAVVSTWLLMFFKGKQVSNAEERRITPDDIVHTNRAGGI